MRGQRRADRVRPGEGQSHPVHDGQAPLLPQLVEGPDELAGQPLPAQVVVEVEIERHRPAAVLGQRERRVPHRAELHVVPGELHARDVDGLAGVERPLQRAAVGLLERGLDLGQARSEARTEPPEVGRHLPGQEVGERVDVLDDLDVQLLGDLAPDVVVERPARVEEQGPSQRLADLDLGVGAGRSTEGDQPAGAGHALGQRRVAPARRPRPVGQVHRAAPEQGAVHLVGQEGAERGEEASRPDEDVVEGRVGRVLRGLPEPPPRPPHVPVREVVHEAAEAAGRGRARRSPPGRP